MFAKTFDALLLDIDDLTAHDRDGSLRSRVARLVAASVSVGLLTKRSLSDLNGALDELRTGPGPVLLATDSGTRLFRIDETGVHPRAEIEFADDAASDHGWHLLLGELARRGVPAAHALLLTAGENVPADLGVTEATLSDAATLLDEQLARRVGKRVPTIEADPAWTVVDDGPSRRRPGAQAALFTVGDGTVATRGVPDEDPGGAAVLATGTYIGTGSKQHLRSGPGWTALVLADAPAASAASPAASPAAPAEAAATATGTGRRRVLDLRSGVLLREDLSGEVPLRTLRFASVVRPGVQVLRAEGPVGRLSAGPPLQPPAEGDVEMGREDGVTWARTVGDIGGIAAAAVQDVLEEGPRRVVERMAAYRGDATQTPDVDEALEALSDAARAGFDTLLAEHRKAWATRWASVDVEIPDDPAAQQAFRFALFQLWSNVGCPTDENGAWDGSERAVGARGLSGQGYAGHVFWDADIFTLPAMASICPAAARAMLEYRIRRLPIAEARARADRRDGARFPWESARDGDEVTPTSGLLGAEIMPIRTGELEEHIVADVAWAADRYASWTGDEQVLTGAARPLIIETARYWAYRIARTPDGRGHIDDVIGPDEYHEGIDDNAFTNIMARWNLRRGAALTTDEDEARHWRGLADSLVDGFDETTGVHEQFAGYAALEPLVVEGVAPLPFAADLVLGRDRVWRSQIIKQADVLMAHFLVPGELPAGSLQSDLAFYVPRTSRGSSLSPAITAALLARSGRPDEGLDTLRMALRLDLDDLTGSSTGGLHLATIGGTWQALVDGFLGLSAHDGVLQADPRLPSAWKTLRVRLRVLEARIALHITPGELTLTTDRPLRFRPSGSDVVDVAAIARFERTDDGWHLRP